MDKELGSYYEANQPEEKVNYIKGNMIGAENHPTTEIKKQYFVEQNKDKVTKQIRSQTRKLMMDIEYREQAKLGLNRWEEYRAERQMYIDRAVMLIKTKRRNQVLISLVKQ